MSLVVGARFEDILSAGENGHESEWIEQRFARHAKPSNTEVQHLAGDRWIRVEERRTADGVSIGVRIDITDLKRREASFRLLFDGNPIPMFVCETNSLHFLAINDATVRNYAYGREQFLAMSLLDILVGAGENCRREKSIGANDTRGRADPLLMSRSVISACVTASKTRRCSPRSMLLNASARTRGSPTWRTAIC